MSETTVLQEMRGKTSAENNEKAIKAMKVSFVAMLLTSLFQAVVVYFSGSSALLADTLHNFADAFTAIPLWMAFLWSRRRPSARYTYGYSRFEDIAGIFIILLIFATAVFIGYDSIIKMEQKYVVRHLPMVMGASIIGFIGNEIVAQYRIKVGREIKSPALIADGQHARVDGITSLGVLVGAIGVWLGFPLSDPIVGIVIALLIIHIGWESGRDLFSRLADATTPGTLEDIEEVAKGIKGVLDVHDTRARHVGQSLRVDLTIEVRKDMTVFEGHEIAIQVQHALQKKFPNLISPMIHVDPEGHTGEDHHYKVHHQKPD